MKKLSRAHIARRGGQHSKIKVFIVEDTEIGVEGMIRLIELNPEKDLEYVGSCSMNKPDLPVRIKNSGADVVVIDVVLGTGIHPEEITRQQERNGIAAIKAIRQSLEQKIKILALTLWPQFRDEALDAGADGFHLKAATNDEIRLAIRLISHGQSVPPLPGFWISKMTGLRLFLKSREFMVTGSHVNTNKISLEPAQFAFLHYLSEERVRSQTNWVVKVSEKGAGYRILEHELWSQICEQAGSSNAGIYHLETKTISRWCCEINKKVKNYLEKNRTPQQLIQVPGKG